MSKSTIVAVFIIVLAIIGVGAFFMLKDSDTTTEQASNSVAQNQEKPNTTNQDSNLSAKTYTLSEVNTHNSKSDCWTIINGKVYNLTSYVNNHPGGDEILQACGKDGSSLFNQRKTESGQQVGTGTPHSESAKSALDALLIGVVAS